jgi:hypothetical protein
MRIRVRGLIDKLKTQIYKLKSKKMEGLEKRLSSKLEVFHTEKNNFF